MATTASAPPPPLCDLCESSPATVHCEECSDGGLGRLCADDDASMHADARRKAHTRKPISGGTATTTTTTATTKAPASITAIAAVNPALDVSAILASTNGVPSRSGSPRASSPFLGGGVSSLRLASKAPRASVFAPSPLARPSTAPPPLSPLSPQMTSLAALRRGSALFGGGGGSAAGSRRPSLLIPSSATNSAATSPRPTIIVRMCDICTSVRAAVHCDTCRRDGSITTSQYCLACSDDWHTSRRLGFHFRQPIEDALKSLQAAADLQQVVSVVGGVGSGSSMLMPLSTEGSELSDNDLDDDDEDKEEEPVSAAIVRRRLAAASNTTQPSPRTTFADQTRHAAATKIQAVYRGSASRKRTADIRTARASGPRMSSLPSSASSPSLPSDQLSAPSSVDTSLTPSPVVITASRVPKPPLTRGRSLANVKHSQPNVVSLESGMASVGGRVRVHSFLQLAPPATTSGATPINNDRQLEAAADAAAEAAIAATTNSVTFSSPARTPMPSSPHTGPRSTTGGGVPSIPPLVSAHPSSFSSRRNSTTVGTATVSGVTVEWANASFRRTSSAAAGEFSASPSASPPGTPLLTGSAGPASKKPVSEQGLAKALTRLDVLEARLARDTRTLLDERTALETTRTETIERERANQEAAREEARALLAEVRREAEALLARQAEQERVATEARAKHEAEFAARVEAAARQQTLHEQATLARHQATEQSALEARRQASEELSAATRAFESTRDRATSQLTQTVSETRATLDATTNAARTALDTSAADARAAIANNLATARETIAKESKEASETLAKESVAVRHSLTAAQEVILDELRLHATKNLQRQLDDEESRRRSAAREARRRNRDLVARRRACERASRELVAARAREEELQALLALPGLEPGLTRDQHRLLAARRALLRAEEARITRMIEAVGLPPSASASKSLLASDSAEPTTAASFIGQDTQLLEALAPTTSDTSTPREGTSEWMAAIAASSSSPSSSASSSSARGSPEELLSASLTASASSPAHAAFARSLPLRSATRLARWPTGGLGASFGLHHGVTGWQPPGSSPPPPITHAPSLASSTQHIPAVFHQQPWSSVPASPQRERSHSYFDAWLDSEAASVAASPSPRPPPPSSSHAFSSSHGHLASRVASSPTGWSVSSPTGWSVSSPAATAVASRRAPSSATGSARRMTARGGRAARQQAKYASASSDAEEM